MVQILDAPDFQAVERTLASWVCTLVENRRRWPRLYDAEETFELLAAVVSASRARDLELEDHFQWRCAARGEYYAALRAGR